jgi:flavin reductase (DIM6/NTAB) family NADH-FMN oxidoreductase RutF
MMDGTEGLAMQSFTPGPETRRDYRNALGRFGTGVTLVTAPGPIGITANSFASVSLDPALVLWSVDCGSDRYADFCKARYTAIHVLSAEQGELAMAFARKGSKFGDVPFTENDTGVPLLADCLARFECTLSAVHDGGDHKILVSRVTRATVGEGPPLLFVGGRFGSFTD